MSAVSSGPSGTAVRRDEPPGRGERIVAIASGIVTFVLVGGVLGTYVYGSSLPERHQVSVAVDLPVAVDEAYALLSDMEARPSWRPDVERIGRIHDDDAGHQVWRELDAGGDRFDLKVLSTSPPQRVVLATASPDQIGYDAVWTWQLQSSPDGSVVTLTEEGAIDNPLWRGLFYLRAGPESTVRDELRLLSTQFGGSEPWTP